MTGPYYTGWLCKSVTSGGDCLDLEICLIVGSGVRRAGVNTAIYSPSGGNSGVGFAIPVDELRRSVEQIIQYGKVVRPILGISFAPDQSVEQVPPRPKPYCLSHGF